MPATKHQAQVLSGKQKGGCHRRNYSARLAGTWRAGHREHASAADASFQRGLLELDKLTAKMRNCLQPSNRTTIA
jgi:hypothetical protein